MLSKMLTAELRMGFPKQPLGNWSPLPASEGQVEMGEILWRTEPDKQHLV